MRGALWIAAILLITTGCETRNGPAMTDEKTAVFQTEPERAFITAVLARNVAAATALGARLPARFDTAAPSGETGLLYAVLANDVPMVKALLDAGANPNGGPDRAPLHPATRDPSGRLVDMLLRAKANPNLTYNDETPLFEAALVDARANAGKLIDAGADLNKGNGIGHSPAMTAAAAGHWIMVNMLIDRGASPWHTPPNGFTLANFAATDRLKPETPEGQARDAIIVKFRALGHPWPPPKPPEVRKMMAEGRWPPRLDPAR